MKIEEVLIITNHIENIDGEEVFILDREMRGGIEKLKKGINIEGRHLFAMLEKDIEFICAHTDFALAFRPIKWGNDRRCIPCLIYKYKGEWRRVVHQYAHCLVCDWQGSVVSPMEPDLYLELEDRFNILKELDKLPFCNCPKCGNKLSTQAIWIENEKK